MSDTTPAGTIKVREGAAVWRQIEDETVLLALDSSTYLGLNHTGTVVWPLMVDGTTRDEMVNRLVSRFGVNAARAAADIDAFVDACHEQGLLVAQR
jgi:Coenzyme PQQ synthesis protein D (PqqD)